MKINTRIAPSPTGHFHLGTARTAYFNWLAAKASGGKFILRIDDTDLSRNNIEAVNLIYASMKWLGLDWYNTFSQSDNYQLYRYYADALIKSNKAQVIDGGAIQLLDPILPAYWTDTIAGDIAITDQDIDVCSKLILIKSDGTPTYNFATVIDDYTHDINYIIRGTDHISNTPKQLAIIHGLGIKPPKYAHVGLLFMNKKKLSKRDPSSSLVDYMHYSPDAVLNFLLRLGWGPYKDDKSTAIITKDRAIQMFLSDGKMKSSNANIDLVKLDSFNRKYSNNAY